MLSPRGKKELKINQRRILINSIEIGIPAPEQVFILGQRHTSNGKIVGRIRNSKTLNYKSFTPHRDGLFCERIFGPVQSYICACGKQGPLTTSKGTLKFCPRCEVEYTDQRARRYRVGYIGLVSPVTHIWHLKGRPSYLSLFLGKRKKTLATLAYCNDYLVEQAFSKVSVNGALSFDKQYRRILCFPTLLRSKSEQTEEFLPPYGGSRHFAKQSDPVEATEPYGFTSRSGRSISPQGSEIKDVAKEGLKRSENYGATFFKNRILKGLNESKGIKGFTLSREQEKSKVCFSEKYFRAGPFDIATRPRALKGHTFAERACLPEVRSSKQAQTLPSLELRKVENFDKQNRKCLTFLNFLRQLLTPEGGNHNSGAYISPSENLEAVNSELSRSGNSRYPKVSGTDHFASQSGRFTLSGTENFRPSKVGAQSSVRPKVRGLRKESILMLPPSSAQIKRKVFQPLLGVSGKTGRQQRDTLSYTRSHTLPFLPTFICEFHLRDGLLSFFDTFPPSQDIPIPAYCKIPRRYPLRDVHKFMADQAFSKVQLNTPSIPLPPSGETSTGEREAEQIFACSASLSKRKFEDATLSVLPSKSSTQGVPLEPVWFPKAGITDRLPQKGVRTLGFDSQKTLLHNQKQPRRSLTAPAELLFSPRDLKYIVRNSANAGNWQTKSNNSYSTANLNSKMRVVADTSQLCLPNRKVGLINRKYILETLIGTINEKKLCSPFLAPFGGNRNSGTAISLREIAANRSGVLPRGASCNFRLLSEAEQTKVCSSVTTCREVLYSLLLGRVVTTLIGLAPSFATGLNRPESLTLKSKVLAGAIPTVVMARKVGSQLSILRSGWPPFSEWPQTADLRSARAGLVLRSSESPRGGQKISLRGFSHFFQQSDPQRVFKKSLKDISKYEKLKRLNALLHLKYFAFAKSTKLISQLPARFLAGEGAHEQYKVYETELQTFASRKLRLALRSRVPDRVLGATTRYFAAQSKKVNTTINETLFRPAAKKAERNSLVLLSTQDKLSQTRAPLVLHQSSRVSNRSSLSKTFVHFATQSARKPRAKSLALKSKIVSKDFKFECADACSLPVIGKSATHLTIRLVFANGWSNLGSLNQTWLANPYRCSSGHFANTSYARVTQSTRLNIKAGTADQDRALSEAEQSAVLLRKVSPRIRQKRTVPALPGFGESVEDWLEYWFDQWLQNRDGITRNDSFFYHCKYAPEVAQILLSKLKSYDRLEVRSKSQSVKGLSLPCKVDQRPSVFRPVWGQSKLCSGNRLVDSRRLRTFASRKFSLGSLSFRKIVANTSEARVTEFRLPLKGALSECLDLSTLSQSSANRNVVMGTLSEASPNKTRLQVFFKQSNPIISPVGQHLCTIKGPLLLLALREYALGLTGRPVVHTVFFINYQITTIEGHTLLRKVANSNLDKIRSVGSKHNIASYLSKHWARTLLRLHSKGIQRVNWIKRGVFFLKTDDNTEINCPDLNMQLASFETDRTLEKPRTLLNSSAVNRRGGSCLEPIAETTFQLPGLGPSSPIKSSAHKLSRALLGSANQSSCFDKLLQTRAGLVLRSSGYPQTEDKSSFETTSVRAFGCSASLSKQKFSLQASKIKKESKTIRTLDSQVWLPRIVTIFKIIGPKKTFVDFAKQSVQKFPELCADKPIVAPQLYAVTRFRDAVLSQRLSNKRTKKAQKQSPNTKRIILTGSSNSKDYRIDPTILPENDNQTSATLLVQPATLRSKVTRNTSPNHRPSVGESVALADRRSAVTRVCDKSVEQAISVVHFRGAKVRTLSVRTPGWLRKDHLKNTLENTSVARVSAVSLTNFRFVVAELSWARRALEKYRNNTDLGVSLTRKLSRSESSRQLNKSGPTNRNRFSGSEVAFDTQKFGAERLEIKTPFQHLAFANTSVARVKAPFQLPNQTQDGDKKSESFFSNEDQDQYGSEKRPVLPPFGGNLSSPASIHHEPEIKRLITPLRGLAQGATFAERKFGLQLLRNTSVARVCESSGSTRTVLRTDSDSGQLNKAQLQGVEQNATDSTTRAKFEFTGKGSTDSYMKAQLDLQAIQEVLSYTGGGALREVLRCFDTQAFSVILLNEIKLLREYHKGYLLYEYDQVSRKARIRAKLESPPLALSGTERASSNSSVPLNPRKGCTDLRSDNEQREVVVPLKAEGDFVQTATLRSKVRSSKAKEAKIDNKTPFWSNFRLLSEAEQAKVAETRFRETEYKNNYDELPEEINRFSRAIHRNARRLKIVQLLMRNKRRPEWMLISALPVLPPDLRPILQMSENMIVASDLNTLYQRVIYRNNRQYKLRIVEWSYATSLQRLVQDAVDRLIENGKGGSKPFLTPSGRPLKSLSDTLKGKKGRFRLNLLGKRVDFSGRSVIVVSPYLKIHECGLPREMALELYQYLLIRQMLLKRQVSSVILAKRVIRQQKALVWDTLRELIYHHPLLLNRAPTLHRLGIQAFQPKLVLGSTILLHPLVCAGFNADFDGDQMGVHLPLCDEARAEAWDLLWSRNNLLSPATGEPILLPSQDMVLGFYHMTALLPSQHASSTTQTARNTSYARVTARANFQRADKIGRYRSYGFVEIADCSAPLSTSTQIRAPLLYEKGFYKSHFFSPLDVVRVYQKGELDIHTPIWLQWKGKIENNDSHQTPLELRINSFGVSTQLYPSYKYRKNVSSKSIATFNLFIRTTPGRVIVNNMFLARPE